MAALALIAVAMLVLGGCTAVSTAHQTQQKLARSDIQLVTVNRSLTNPYEAQWIEGARWYAASVGLPLKTIISEGDSQKQLSQIRAIAASGKKVVMTINPNAAADVPAIVQSVRTMGGYVVTQWNKPSDQHPWDVGPSWVSHVSYDGRISGYETGTKLLEAIGGSGGVVALQGTLDNQPTKERFAGLQRAIGEHPGAVLLDDQTAKWERNEAYQVTQSLLTKHGNAVKGVWAANDSMALGAARAVKEAGREAQVKIASASDAVPEALHAIKNGDSLVATFSTDSYYNGAMGIATAYQAAVGEIDVNSLPRDRREYYVGEFAVDKSNVDEHLAPPAPESVLSEVAKGPFARYTGPLQ
ncbi:sugar ABC transporter substrate-binding protein [Saccharopolyspora sp. NPDC049426]|uniref:sugar ABC transporter substrate-binding protein n=1 Tax=Saccharopolyspora sp. NPDC049426 TaxID=3155652 RepID=UPI003443B532